MSKPEDILNRMRNRNTGADALLESMYEQTQEKKKKTENDNEQKTVQFTENKHKQEHKTVSDNKPATKSILEKYADKKTKEELFTRQTYLIRNDLIARFDEAAKTRGKGFKTDVVNEILERFLDENDL